MPIINNLRTILAVFLVGQLSWIASAQPPVGRFRHFDSPAREEQLTPEEVEIDDGAAAILDKPMFDKLSYRGREVLIDTHLADQQFVKFQIEGVGGADPLMYFINTKTHRAHMMFMRAVGIPIRGFGPGGGGKGQMRGVLIYHPKLQTPVGDTGLFSYEFEPNDSFPFEMIQRCHRLLLKKMPLLQNRLVYYPMPAAIPQYEEDKEQYEAAGLPVSTDQDIKLQAGYLALNSAESFGRLRRMELGDRPTAREIVLVRALPNTMPRVAGVISEMRQTPLSHVNLRAIQDEIPNAFIHGAAKNERMKSLLGKYVSYKVTADDYEIREATAKEVDAHFSQIRPPNSQVPLRDLTIRQVRALDEIRFSDSINVGTKAANLATMRGFGFPEGTIPKGYAIPFYFYDEFMKHNDLYEAAREIVEDDDLRSDGEALARKLKRFRSRIKKAVMPNWMMTALETVQHAFANGQSIRCRSSTNNEDLPGFSGAGLYDSCTHHPQEGHFSNSIKQVYASLWNYRAYEEREFYRVDHFTTAMGVLVHPNFTDEIANGVAITDDVFYQTQGNYYLNTQVGEDLVTNPEEQSVPEEILLNWSNAEKFDVLRYSNRAPNGKTILQAEQLAELSRHLARTHAKFSRHYDVDVQDPRFAMEVEFKVSHDGRLVIKQARPWVFAPRPANEPVGK